MKAKPEPELDPLKQHSRREETDRQNKNRADTLSPDTFVSVVLGKKSKTLGSPASAHHCYATALDFANMPPCVTQASLKGGPSYLSLLPGVCSVPTGFVKEVAAFSG